MTNESKSRGAMAIRKFQEASRHEIAPVHDVTHRVMNGIHARQATGEGLDLLNATGPLVQGAGEAANVDVRPDHVWTAAESSIIDTLERPNSVSVGASEHRLKAAEKLGILRPAVDASVSAGATNSLEKMLCHQMAAAHHAAMTLLANSMDSELPPVEMVRMANAAARMMDVYQAAMLTLQRFRSGGKQTVVVQHVRVSEGGQAIVAGTVRNGSRRRAARSGRNTP